MSGWSMTGLFKKMAATVAETVAPLILTKLEQLQITWKKIDEEFMQMVQSSDDVLDNPQSLDKSKISELLGQLLQILVTEETENRESGSNSSNSSSSVNPLSGSDETTSPCMEYFLQQGILDRLCGLGMADRPPGVRKLIIKTLDAIFTHIQQNILPNMGVHKSLLQFLSTCHACGDLQGKGSRRVFVSLLRTLCFRLREDPSLVGVFFIEHGTEHGRPEFLLFSSLLLLVNAESEDGQMAREGLLCCLQLPVEAVSLFAVNHTLFCEQLVFGVRERYEKLPKTADQMSTPEAQIALQKFLHWLDFVNMVAQSSFQFVSEKVSLVLVRDFLRPMLLPALLHSTDPRLAACATGVMRRLVERLEAPALHAGLVRFLLGDDQGPELFVNDLDADQPASAAERAQAHALQLEQQQGQLAAAAASAGVAGVSAAAGASSAAASRRLRATVINRINDVNEEVALATLNLFDTLISTRSTQVVFNLLLRTLQTCRFVPDEQRDALRTQSDIAHVKISEIMAPFPTLGGLAKFQLLESYLVDAQTEGQLWVDKWESWLAEQQRKLAESSFSSQRPSMPVTSKKSASAAEDGKGDDDDDVDGADHDDHDDEAKEAVADDEDDDDADEESPFGPFYPGLFMTNLFDRLVQLHSNTFEINLALTGVLAKLCYCPSPLLHAYMFEPALSTRSAPQQVTFFRILAKVYTSGQQRASQMAAYQQRLDDMRRRLNNEEEAPDGVIPAAESATIELFLQGQIVLEEFIKELLAISQAKLNMQNSAAKLQQKFQQHLVLQQQAKELLRQESEAAAAASANANSESTEAMSGNSSEPSESSPATISSDSGAAENSAPAEPKE